MGHSQNFTDTVWIVGPLGQAIDQLNSNPYGLTLYSRALVKTCKDKLIISEPPLCPQNRTIWGYPVL